MLPLLPPTPALAPPLQAILNAELAAGNAVAEISAWPPRCELLLVLRQPFGRRYPLAEGITYYLLNDPHYWLAEYSYDDGRQVLACRFA